MAFGDPEDGGQGNTSWFEDNAPPADPYHDPSNYAGGNPYHDPQNYAIAGGATPNELGGYSTPPPIDTKTGQYAAGWGQGADGLWHFTDPGATAPQQQQQAAGPSAASSGGFSSNGSSGDSGRPGMPNLSDFRSPNPLQPWNEQFNAPTAAEATNSPGFKFRLDEGLKGLQRSAAAKGKLLTGGTLKGLDEFAQNLASNEYKDVYNRAYNEYDSRRQNFLTNESNRYSSESQNLGQQWNINTDYFNMGRVNRLDDFNIFNTNRGFDYSVYNDDRNLSRGLNNDYFNNAIQLAALGRPPAPNV
jgi:hypothetical protein